MILANKIIDNKKNINIILLYIPLDAFLEILWG